MQTSERLRQKIDLGLYALLAAGEQIQRPEVAADLYPEYLCVIHQMIRASVPLMETASDRAERLAREGDAVADGVASYLRHHIREEKDHDEWLLQDLESIDVSREEVWRRPPSPTVASLVGAQYYWVNHHHPLALLGYIAILEGYPPQMEQLEQLEQLTGYPQAAFRTLRKHSHLDVRHSEDLDRALDELPLEHGHERLLGLSALHTVAMATEALNEVALVRADLTVSAGSSPI